MQSGRLKRRKFMTLLGGAAVAWPPAARAQQRSSLGRIGVLSIFGPEDPQSQAFRKRLQELGYVEGQNVSLDWRFAADQEQLARYCLELIQRELDVIVATSSVPARLAHNATDKIPIVFAAVSDPIEQGFVRSFSRPDGNMTGFSNSNVELSGKRLEILRQAVTKLTRLAVLYNPANPVSKASFHELELPARALAIVLEPVEASGPVELGAAIASLPARRPDALFVGPDPMFLRYAREIGQLTTQSRFPTIHTGREFVVAGGLLGYGPPLLDMYRGAAVYVDRILKGAKPADLPVQAPTKYELAINLKTAKALGLTVPDTLLARADEVIE
jgi:putative ABC transport system substrate-binding protein